MGVGWGGGCDDMRRRGVVEGAGAGVREYRGGNGGGGGGEGV
jgi:hypothetical protein